MTGRAIVRDGRSGRWLLFDAPRETIVARTADEVVPAIRAAADAAERGLWAAGFVGFEAGPAFDPSLATRPPGAIPLVFFGVHDAPRVAPGLPDPGADPAPPDEWSSDVSEAEHARAVASIRRSIARGDVYQVNYTMRLRAPYRGDPYAWFHRLAEAQEAEHAAYIDTGAFVLLSASPELFFDLDGERIECRPMKGTAARGLGAADDAAAAERLRASAKERAENLMIVDMARNDLGRIAATGSVETVRLFETERYPTVWQMTSTVRARTPAPADEIFGALFPPASVTGAPKGAAMKIIAGLERSPRGAYTGAAGFFAPGRRASFNVAIRTVVVDRAGGEAEYGVGGGIVWDSTAAGEYDECRVKARVLAERRPRFSLLETMRWSPDEGYFLLDRHLRRLAASALYFGFPWDEADARRRLDALARDFAGEKRRVRLLAARDGSLTLEAALLGDRSESPVVAAVLPGAVRSDDPFLYHKTTRRDAYERALVARPGAEDVILGNERGEITESCFANVVIEKGGRRRTPAASCGLLAGTFRDHLIERGEVEEAVVPLADLAGADRVWLINSVRGSREAKIAD